MKDITKSKLSKEDVFLLREKFIHQYSRNKGWNPKELSTKQMLEITAQDPYKNPKLG